VANTLRGDYSHGRTSTHGNHGTRARGAGLHCQQGTISGQLETLTGVDTSRSTREGLRKLANNPAIASAQSLISERINLQQAPQTFSGEAGCRG
jgi:hypothetical protein